MDWEGFLYVYACINNEEKGHEFENLKEGLEGCVGKLGGRKWKGKMV